MKDATWGDPVFQASAVFERGGLRIGVIGQAFPYTPIANPRYLMPDWSFGIDEDRIAANVERLRTDKVDLVVLLSHNGFDVDRKLANRVKGIDVILTGHTHDALADAGQGRRHPAGRGRQSWQVPGAARRGGAATGASRTTSSG